MGESSGVRNAVVAGLIAGPVALLFGVVALVVAAVGGGTSANDQARIESLESKLAILSSDADAMDRRIVELGERAAGSTPAAGATAAAGLTEEDVRRIAAAEARDLHVRTTGTLGVNPVNVPRVVMDACLKIVPGVAIARAEQRADDGRVYYRLYAAVDDDEYEIDLWDNGALREAEIPQAAVPAEVAATVEREIPGLAAGKVRRTVDDGRDVYEVEGEAGGGDVELRIAADGTLLESEMPVGLAPQAVRDAAAAAVPGIELRTAGKELDDGETNIVFAGRAGRDKYTITVTPAGAVTYVDLPSAKLPQAVLDAVAKVAPQVRLGKRAGRSIEDGKVTYELEGRRGKDEYEFVIAEDGTVLEQKLPDRAAQPGRDEAPKPEPPDAHPNGPDAGGPVEVF